MTDDILSSAESDFKKVLEHLHSEFSHLQIGRASAAIVEGLMVDAYGTKQPLKSVASISIPDAKTVQIQPWDRGQLQGIEKAIINSDLNLAPSNDGVVIRLNLPPMTEERRKDLSKVVTRMAEEARISIRHSRQKALDAVKDLAKNSQATEDQVKSFEKKLQEKVDKYNMDIEMSSKTKEHDILTV